MTNTETLILDATVRAVSNYGMRKTSMSDIAVMADVSRQTVYNLFGKKERIFHAAIVHLGETWRAKARALLQKAEGLPDQLDVLLKVFAIDAYKFSHMSPASTDMFFEAHNSAPKALKQFTAENRKLYQDVFRPYEPALSARDISSRVLSERFDITLRACIRDAASLSDLKALLTVEKELILAAVGR